MKICKTCGAPMEDEAAFCPMCGGKNESNNYSDEGTTVLNSNNTDRYEGNFQNTQPVAAKKKKMSKGLIAVIVILCVLVLAAIGAIVEKSVNNSKYRDDYSFSDSDMGTEDYENYDNNEVNLFEFGTVENNTYSNNFADLHIDLPSESWSFMTSEEIANDYLGGASLDTVNDKAYSENETEKSYFDTVLYNYETNENIQVQLVQGLTYSHKNSSAQDMLDALLSQVDSQYVSMGYSVTDKSKYDYDASIGVNDYALASIDISISDGAEIGQLYAITKVGEDTFVVIVISGSASDAELTELLNLFY